MRELEHIEAVRLMTWVRGALVKWPQLEGFHHIPNGGWRSKAQAGKLKAEGVKAGVSDYFLPWAAWGCHGLYLELKAGKNKPTQDQLRFLQLVHDAGYAAAVCTGASAAVDCLEGYLDTQAMDGLDFSWGVVHFD